MSDAITQATKQVAELASFRTFLAIRNMERFVIELEDTLKEVGISTGDRRDIFARLSGEAEQMRRDLSAQEEAV